MSWTAADAAEQDVLIDELARCFIEHRQDCDNCQNHQPCPQLRTAIDVVLEWRRHRELLTRAQQLRLHQDIRDVAA